MQVKVRIFFDFLLLYLYFLIDFMCFHCNLTFSLLLIQNTSNWSDCDNCQLIVRMGNLGIGCVTFRRGWREQTPANKRGPGVKPPCLG